MHDYCTTATTADALKRLAVLHYINTCVNVTLYYHTYRYKALQKYLRCLIMLILLIDNENICTDTNFIDLKKYC